MRMLEVYPLIDVCEMRVVVTEMFAGLGLGLSLTINIFPDCISSRGTTDWDTFARH